MMRWRRVLAVTGALLLTPLGTTHATDCPSPRLLTWAVGEERPLPAHVFTQGFEIADGRWWLSSGGYGQSEWLRGPADDIRSIFAFPRQRFAEGLSLSGDQLWVLTWRAGEAWVFDRHSGAHQTTHQFSGEGWGLAWFAERERFLMSDGTASLTWRDAADFRDQGRITVRLGAKPLPRLNELERVGEAVFANVWLTEQVVRIDVETGCVTGLLDLRTLWPATQRPPRSDVLNGLAWDAGREQLWVTGKRWGRAFALTITD